MFEPIETVALVLSLAAVLITAIVCTERYYDREFSYRQTAIAHGCMVNSAGVICPEGDRK